MKLNLKWVSKNPVAARLRGFSFLLLISFSLLWILSCQGPQGVSRYKHPEEKSQSPREDSHPTRFDPVKPGEVRPDSSAGQQSRFQHPLPADRDPLLEFVSDWKGTPYRYGGMSRSGTDCSGFMKNLFSAVYGITLPRTSREQFTAGREISRENLKKGDLVFFKLRRNRPVSHVGVYLGNNQFAHASLQIGVTIDDLDLPYYKKSWAGARRVLN